MMTGSKIDGAKGAAEYMRTMRSPLAAAVAVGLLMGMVAPAARAVDSHWQGTVSTDWSDAANWDAAPAAGGHVFIDVVSPHDSVLTGAGADIDQLTVGDQATGSLTLSGGGVLAVHGNDMNGSGAVFGRAKGSMGSVTVTGAGSTLTVDQGVQIGSEGTGSLSVVSGGTANLALTGAYEEVLVGYGYYGQSPDAASGSGTVEVDGAGSTLNYAGGFNLLNGSLTVSDGGRLESQSRGDSGWIDILGLGEVASSADSQFPEYALDGQGTATVTGAGSSWQSVNSLQVGDGGTGRLSVLDGATASFSGSVVLGSEVTTYDYIQDPDTGATTTTAVGSKRGNGTVEVSGEGSALTVVAAAGLGNGDLVVGDGGDGTLSVDDKGSVDVAGRLTVGNRARGTVTITGGGALAVHGGDADGMGAILGNAVGSEGDVTVSGAGSVLTLDAGAQVGNFGNGSLTVQQGGTASIGLATAYSETVVGLGYYGAGGPDAAKGTGAITVEGKGSTLDYAGGMNLLNGSVMASDGGHLASQSRSGDQGTTWLDVIGYGLPADDDILFRQLTGEATATVTGAGSAWNSVNALDVGDGGTGTLNVLDGGKASFTGWAYLGDAALLYANGTSTGLTQAGTGTVNVSGDGSSLTVAAPPEGSNGTDTGLFVGYKGEGMLSVDDKGSVDVAGQLVVGDQAKGTLSIAGAGTLAVHGGDANAVGVFLGRAAGGEGDITVSGSNSLLSVDQGMRVGYDGTGVVSIEQGGEVKVNGDMFAGDVVGGHGGRGSISVKGSGSILDVAGDRLEIDTGSLTVSDGAHVSVGDGLVVGENGALNIAGGGTVTATTFYHDGSNLVVTGDGSSLSADGWQFSDYGTVTVSNGGKISSTHPVDIQGDVLIGGVDANGTVQAPGIVDFPELFFMGTPTTLTFQNSSSASNEYDFAANLASGAGEGHIAVKAGFIRLTGDSSEFGGSTVVDGGATLSVNGSLGGDIDVVPGGRLQGTGTVDNVTIGGTLAPGNSPGTLHVKGDLVMRTGSVYEAQIDPATGKSDSVEVAGNVTIQPGTTLQIQSLGDQPLTPGAQINLIQSTGKGTVQGQFDNTEGDLTDFMGYGVSYQDGKVVVDVTRSSTSFASAGDTPQARALGAALDGVAPDSALGMLLFGQLTGAGQAALAFKQMAGTIHADVRRVMLDDSRQPRDAVEQRLRQAGDAEGTAWWVHALGDWSHADGSDGLAGAKADSSGGMVGVDTDVGDGSRVGVAAGLGQTSYRMGDQGSAHLKDRHLAFYGRSVAGHVDLGYGLAATWHDIGTHRAFVVGNAPQQLNSDSHARTDQLFVDAGYRFGDSVRRYLEPYVALAHVRLHSHAVHEHGSVTALDVASGSDHATFGTLGLRWSAGAGVARWYGTLGWRHVFGFDRPSVQAQFAGGGAAFAVQGLPMARNAAQLELGASFAVGSRAHIAFGYDGLLAGSASDNGAKAQLTVDF
jgi:outer membrane autotransporter protein